MKRTTCVLCVLASACFASGGGDPVEGIYDLSVVALEDSCTPNRFVGELESVAVFRLAEVLNIPLPEGESPARQELPTPHFAREAVVDYLGCPELALQIEWVATELSHDSFTILVIQRWEGVAGCTEEDPALGAPPRLDCTSERELHFDLIEACDLVCGFDGCGCR